MFEAWNRGDTANFGWGVGRALGYNSLDPETGAGINKVTSSSSGAPISEKGSEEGSQLKRKWIWFSTDPKYLHEMGWLAAFAQFWAATIFWIAGWVSEFCNIQQTCLLMQCLPDGLHSLRFKIRSRRKLVCLMAFSGLLKL